MKSEFGALLREKSHSFVCLLVHHLILELIRATASLVFCPRITNRFYSSKTNIKAIKDRDRSFVLITCLAFLILFFSLHLKFSLQDTQFSVER